MAAGRQYIVAGRKLPTLDAACGRAVALSIATRETVCVETKVRGHVVERIDVAAALSIDDDERATGHA